MALVYGIVWVFLCLLLVPYVFFGLCFLKLSLAYVTEVLGYVHDRLEKYLG